MNKITLLLTGALLFPITAAADMVDQQQPPHHRLEKLETELQLNNEQKSKLEAVFKEQHEKFRAIHDETHARVKEILTPEQLGKWEAMQQQRKEIRRQKMQEPVGNRQKSD